MKTCPRCKAEKQEAEFYRHPVSGRVYPYCRPCANEYNRERAKAKKEKAKKEKAAPANV